MLKQLEDKNKATLRKFLMTGEEKYLDEIRESRKAILENHKPTELLKDMGHEEKLSLFYMQKDFESFAITAKEAFKSRASSLTRSKNKQLEVKIELGELLQKYGLKIVSYCGSKSKLLGRKALVIGAYYGNSRKPILRVFDLEECSFSGWLTTSCKIVEKSLEEFLNIQSEYQERMRYKFNKYYKNNSNTGKLEFQRVPLNSLVSHRRVAVNDSKLVGNIINFKIDKVEYKGVCVNENEHSIEVYLLPEYVMAGDFRLFINKKDNTDVHIEGEFYATYFTDNLFAKKQYITDKYIFRNVNDGTLTLDDLNSFVAKPIIFKNDESKIQIIEYVDIKVTSKRGIIFPYVKIIGNNELISLKDSTIYRDFETAMNFRKG
jgi:hypothetical protein